MGLLRKKEPESRTHVVIDDTLMQRRQKQLFNERKELQNRVNDLLFENRYLQEEIKRLNNALEGMTVAHSLDEVINHYKEQSKSSVNTANPFVGLLGKIPKTDAAASSAESEGIASDMMSPDEVASSAEIAEAIRSDDGSIFDDILADYKPADSVLKGKSAGMQMGNPQDRPAGRD